MRDQLRVMVLYDERRVATRAGDHNRLVAAFRKYAQAHLTGPDPAEPASVPPDDTRAED